MLANGTNVIRLRVEKIIYKIGVTHSNSIVPIINTIYVNQIKGHIK